MWYHDKLQARESSGLLLLPLDPTSQLHGWAEQEQPLLSRGCFILLGLLTHVNQRCQELPVDKASVCIWRGGTRERDMRCISCCIWEGIAWKYAFMEKWALITMANINSAFHTHASYWMRISSRDFSLRPTHNMYHILYPVLICCAAAQISHLEEYSLIIQKHSLYGVMNKPFLFLAFQTSNAEMSSTDVSFSLPDVFYIGW